jgi:hypothetical protein
METSRFIYVDATTDANGYYEVNLPYTSAVTYLVEVAEHQLEGDLTTNSIVFQLHSVVEGLLYQTETLVTTLILARNTSVVRYLTIITKIPY